MILPLFLADLLYGRPGYSISYNLRWAQTPFLGLFTMARIRKLPSTKEKARR